MANGANDPKKIAKVFEQVAKGYEAIKNNPNAMRTIRVFDALTDFHPAKRGTKFGRMLTKKAWKKIAARRAAKNEAEKAALVGGGLGAATMYQSQKNKNKK